MTLKNFQNTHEWGDQWNGEDLSIFSQDDYKLPGTMEISNEASHSTHAVTKIAARMSSSQALLASSASSGPSSAPGIRAREAFVRPSAIYTAGDLLESGFDLHNCTFTLSLMTTNAATKDAPTEIFLPHLHFSSSQTVVSISSGKWVIRADEELSSTVQRLRWWHGEGYQEIKIQAVKHNANEVSRRTTTASDMEEEPYLERCQNGPCSIV